MEETTCPMNITYNKKLSGRDRERVKEGENTGVGKTKDTDHGGKGVGEEAVCGCWGVERRRKKIKREEVDMKQR